MGDPFEKLTKVSPAAREKLLTYAKLLRLANEKVNLLSRKDMDELEYRHIAFCASISEFFDAAYDARIADVGTGGGLPGIVMAILYPQAKVSMFDGVGKKIAIVNEIIAELKLSNARAFHARIEEHKMQYDYITGRSVCNLPQFFGFVKRSLRLGRKGNLSNGVIYFKGGELEPLLISKNLFPDAEFDLQKFFDDPRYEGKKLAHFDAKQVMKF